MSKTIKLSELPGFDAAEHLPDDKAIAEYLAVVLEENNPSALAGALGTIARARGMTDIANASGLAREALYKALRPGAQPRFDTVQRVCADLGVRLTAVPAERMRLPIAVLIERVVVALDGFPNPRVTSGFRPPTGAVEAGQSCATPRATTRTGGSTYDPHGTNASPTLPFPPRWGMPGARC